jgi:hypothetical protein
MHPENLTSFLDQPKKKKGISNPITNNSTNKHLLLAYSLSAVGCFIQLPISSQRFLSQLRL